MEKTEKKHNIVYIIRNMVNGKIYVGVHGTNRLEDGYMGSGKYLKFAIEKHGLENFEREILFDFDNYSDALEMESRIVTREFCRQKHVYNVSLGGRSCVLYGEDNGFFGRTHSQEWKENFKSNHPTKDPVRGPKIREKMSKSISKHFAENPVSQETRLKLSAASTGRTHSTETRSKLSEINTGRVFTQEHRENISKSRVGVVQGPHSEDHRRKISESNAGKPRPYIADKVNRNPEKIRKTAEKHRGMKRTEETKKNISESKRLYVWETPYGEFPDERTFASVTGLSNGLLRRRCVQNNDRVITLGSLNRASDIPDEEKQNIVGKTWRELGWGRRLKDGLL